MPPISPIMRLFVTCLLFHLAETWAHDQITLHNTHPMISYSPDTTCVPLPFHWWEACHRRHSPWALKDYKDRNTGLNRSYHVTSDRRNGAKGEGPREISFVLHGSPVAIYGAPPSLVGSPAPQELCMDDLVCHSLDVESAYLHAKDMDDRVLIWSGGIPNPGSQPHRFVIRMIGSSSLEDEPEKFMTLDRVIYIPYPGPESPRPYPLPAGATIKDVSIDDTSRRITYYGIEICTSWWWWKLLAGCSTVANSWEKKLFQVKTGSTVPRSPRIRTETYHQATTMFDVGKQDPQSQAIFNFKGSAVCIYGAPRSQISYPHGAQQVCLDESCHYIDTHQLYLNLPNVTSSSPIFPAQLFAFNSVSSASSEVLEDQPVLLWCTEGLDHTKKHRLVYQLVEPNPRYGPGDGGVRKGMTVAHIAYVRVLRHSSFHSNERIMVLFALTSFFSLFVFLVRRCSSSSSNDFIVAPPNVTANFFTGRFGNEHDPLVPNGTPSNSYHYSRIYRYGPSESNRQGHGLYEGSHHSPASSSGRRAESHSDRHQWRVESSNKDKCSANVTPAPLSKTLHRSAPSASEHDRLSRVRETPPLSQSSRHGNFNNRNAEDGHMRRASETPPLSQPSTQNSRNTPQTSHDSLPGQLHHDLPWRVRETPPPSHLGNHMNRNSFDASGSYTYRHTDDQQIPGGPSHVFPASGTASVPTLAPDIGADGAPLPPYTRFPTS